MAKRAEVVRRAKVYIRENLLSPISVATAAAFLNVSESYLSSAFLAETGEAVGAYLTGLRLKKARALMVDKGLLIKEVAQASGFKSPDYFSRLLKEKSQATSKKRNKYGLSLDSKKIKGFSG